MADTRPGMPTTHPDAKRRHEVDVERRRSHPGDPRRPLSVDRPDPRDDRRGAHGWAGERR